MEVGGRKVPKVPKENRICEMCNESLVETEFHSLAECDHSSFARRKFFDRLYSKFPKVRNLSICDQIQFLFICQDEDIISVTLGMKRDYFSQRKKKYRVSEVTYHDYSCFFYSCNLVLSWFAFV